MLIAQQSKFKIIQDTEKNKRAKKKPTEMGLGMTYWYTSRKNKESKGNREVIKAEIHTTGYTYREWGREGRGQQA